VTSSRRSGTSVTWYGRSRSASLARQCFDVGVLHVAAVLAQVRGDAVGPGPLAQAGGGDRVRFVRPAGLTDRRDVIHVHEEPQRTG